MMIRRNTPRAGICFAWTPKQTSEGTVWLETVRYEWIDTGFGGWSYERIKLEDDEFGYKRVALRTHEARP